MSTRLFRHRTTPLLLSDKRIIQRCYHATRKQEIVPVIVATVALVGYYSYRAVRRMEGEWDDHQWELAQYEKKLAKEQDDAIMGKRVAVDFGTCFTKMATSYPSIQVLNNREGERSTFNGVVYDEQNDPISLGNAALERFFFNANDQSVDVVLPFTLLAGANTGGQHSLHEVVHDVLAPIMKSIATMDMTEAEVERIFAVPTAFIGVPENFYAAFGKDHIFVPEPVASVWGAQHSNLLPLSARDTRFLVVDVGGWTTQISLVEKDKVIHSTTVPWGGETMVHTLVDVVAESCNDRPLVDARSLALVQKEARQALTLFSSNTRVPIIVPYLFPDPGAHTLETQVARDVLYKAIEAQVKDVVVPDLDQSSALSPHMPQPTDLTSLWVSVIAGVLEEANVLPNNISNILVVGGGSKAPIVKTSLTQAVDTLTGPFNDTIVWPEMELSTELTVLGAATLPPSFRYSLAEGLVPR